MVDFGVNTPVAGDWGVRWNHGSRSRGRDTNPPIQVHHYDPHTVVMRQNKAVSAEAPFLFLFFGNDRALLLDTGATKDPEKFPLRATVDGLISAWLLAEGRAGEAYPLVVAHTHGHMDHVAGDAQFADRPATTVVARDVEAVKAHFGFTAWPAETVPYDLGGRILEVTGGPGHHRAAIAVYDPWTGLLFTGDTVIPGRLYAFDYPAFLATLDRLVAIARTRPVTWVVGCHVEMSTTPGVDYPVGSRYQPAERPLQLTVDHLQTIRDDAWAAADQPGVHRHDTVIIYHGMGARTQLRLVIAGLRAKLRTAPTVD